MDKAANSEVLDSDEKSEESFTFMRFALLNFRESLGIYSKLVNRKRGGKSSFRITGSIRSKNKGNESNIDWSWKELVDLVKYTNKPLDSPLLSHKSSQHNRMAVDCFKRILKYMGDMPLDENQTDTDCVFGILDTGYKCPPLRDEIYCQLIKQTTSNRSPKRDSCVKGWRLLELISSYFSPSALLKPYLMNHLEAIAEDTRRSWWDNAKLCLRNLEKTFKYGGRRNVPSLEELNALSMDRVIKQQAYYIAGGTKLIVDTWTTSVVQDIIRHICRFLGITDECEMDEYSLCCIVDGDLYTLSLEPGEYVLDVTTELTKNNYVYYILFSRTVWHFPLRLDNETYIDIVYNQMAPDYTDGLFLLKTGSGLSEQTEDEIAKIGALLHRASGLSNAPKRDDIIFLLPKTLPYVSKHASESWMQRVLKHWDDVAALTPVEAKAQCLEILDKWPLFGSSFFTVLLLSEGMAVESVLAINKSGVCLLDVDACEETWECTFCDLHIEDKNVKDDFLVLRNKKDDGKSVSLQTEYGTEVISLIQQYTKIANKASQSAEKNA